MSLGSVTLNCAGFLPIFLDVLSRSLLSSVPLLSVGIHQAFYFFHLTLFFSHFTYFPSEILLTPVALITLWILMTPNIRSLGWIINPRLKPTYLTSLYSLTYGTHIQHVPN